eukprot:scaffold45568_cov59-Cyclotella_meneghiniana.AAC.3
MDGHQRNVPPPPPRPLASSAIRQNPPPPPPRPQLRQLGQGQTTSNNMNASNKKTMRLFLVLTVSCVILLLSGTSSTKPMLDNISTMYETVIQKIDAYQLTVEPSASVDEIEDPASWPP